MNSKSDQTTVLITTLVSLLAIGSIAAYKVLGKRERDDLLRSLSAESTVLNGRIENILTDPENCTLNLKGLNRQGELTSLSKLENGTKVEVYALNKPVGRLKLDRIKLDLLTEEIDQSEIKITYSLSNFADEHSKKILGLKEFEKTVKVKVMDCPTEFVKAADEVALRGLCESLPPEGLGGKAKRIMRQGDISPDFPFMMECLVCRLKNRETIKHCL